MLNLFSDQVNRDISFKRSLLKPISFIFSLCLLFSLFCSASFSLARTVIDSEEREVQVADKVTKVAPLIPAFAQMTEMLTQGDGRISAYPTQVISPFFKLVFPDIVASNPKNYDTGSVEDIVASGAQVVFGPDVSLSVERRAQLEKAGVAVVAINNIASVETICQSFEIIGQILGPEESQRAKEFGQYYKANLQRAKERSSDLKEGERVKVMLVAGLGGRMTTINETDICNEHIEAAGGINVARDYKGTSQGGRLMVDPELIVDWAPEVIVTTVNSLTDEILNNPSLKTIPAVKNGRVYNCPQGIFLWSTRSGEGALMALWLGSKFYPERFKDIDMRAEVKSFFKRFYNFDISESQTEDVLEGRTKIN
ncbi:MAG: ABC transporter substrate-binding protein [Deltaproteobacteria bacterium]|jgi:iron complex transport system substrate-binding protein|nr:ABC transporter substrate-binding protein [Deltaproteobacteria bacterium]